MTGVSDIVAGLTKAQKRAVLNGRHGYNDDNTLDPSGRRMLYRLIERGLFRHPCEISRLPRPDIEITELGLAVRNHLETHHDDLR